MRIALLTQLFPPELEGGTELVVQAQARALQRRGHRVLVLAGTEAAHAGPDLLRARQGSLEVLRVPRLAGEGFDLRLERARVEQLVSRAVEGVDAVHVHHWSTLSSGLVRALARAAPVVVTLHDAFATCPRSFRAPPDPALACPTGAELAPCVDCLEPEAGGLPRAELLGGLRERRAAFAAELQAAAAVIAPSRFHARRMEALLALAAGRIEVLPHGLCRELPGAGRARPAWTGAGVLRVLHHGNLVAAKGILDLVTTLAELPRRSVELHLAGRVLEAGLEAELRRRAGPLRLHLHGPFGDRGLAELAAQSDLAAFPSRLEESYGLVLDEAAALGLPLWVSDRGALPERLAELGGGGRVLPAGDVGAWRAAFEGLLADPTELARERARLRTPPEPDGAVRRLEQLYGGRCAART